MGAESVCESGELVATPGPLARNLPHLAHDVRRKERARERQRPAQPRCIWIQPRPVGRLGSAGSSGAEARARAGANSQTCDRGGRECGWGRVGGGRADSDRAGPPATQVSERRDEAPGYYNLLTMQTSHVNKNTHPFPLLSSHHPALLLLLSIPHYLSAASFERKPSSAFPLASMSPMGLRMLALLFSEMKPLVTISSTM